MRERKFSKLIDMYPNLADGRFELSHAQALKAVEEYGGYPSLEEIVARARARSALPGPAWEPFNRVLPEAAYGNDATANRFGAFFRARRAVVAALAIIMIASFLSFTPAGRALAKRAYDFIIQIVYNGFTVVTHEEIDGNHEIRQDVPFEQQEFPSYDALEDELGYTVYKPELWSGIVQDSLLLQRSNAGITYYGVFSDPEGRYITVIQEFEIGSTQFGFTGTSSREWDGVLSDGTQVHCYISGHDGSFCAIGRWEDSFLMIIADEGIDHTQFVSEE